MRALGHFSQAQHQAQRVLQLRPPDRTRSRAFGKLILATVLIAQRELDHACALAHEVLNTTQSLSSHVVLQQLADVKNLLEPHRKNTAVAGFLACFDQVMGERLCLYRWQSEHQQGHGTDGVEDM